MAEPTDKERAAHRRALALAEHYTRLAEVLVPAIPRPSPMAAKVAERLQALPEETRARLAERAAEVAADSAPDAEERRAAVRDINEAWAHHCGRSDVPSLMEHDVLQALADAVQMQGPDPDLAGLPDAPTRREAEVRAVDMALERLRHQWPAIKVDRELFLGAVRAWKNGYKRVPAVTDLLHRAGLRNGTDIRGVEKMLERFFPQRPGE